MKYEEPWEKLPPEIQETLADNYGVQNLDAAKVVYEKIRQEELQKEDDATRRTQGTD